MRTVAADSSPEGPLTPRLPHAIGRAAGGRAEGRGYYVYSRWADRDRPRRFILRDDVRAELFGVRHQQDAPI